MFYGGLILAVVVALVYIRRIGLPLWTTTDVFAPGIALGHVVGRFGCLFAGCCFGKPTTLPWGITFRDTFAATNVGLRSACRCIQRSSTRPVPNC